MSADGLMKKRIKDLAENHEEWLGYVWSVAKRTTESPIEALICFELHRWNVDHLYPDAPGELKFETQVSIGKYRVDFLLEWNACRIVVECDGHEFHEKTKSQAQRDKSRDRYLTSQGYHVLRYTGSEIYKDPECFHKDVLMIADPTYRSIMLEVQGQGVLE